MGNPLIVYIFGILGNFVSGCVYLAPLPTFWQIYQKKSTLGFQCLPYVVALFSATLWMYYAMLEKHSTLLITINSLGCFIETLYIVFFLIYATKDARRNAIKLIMSLNVCCYGFILLFTLFQFHGSFRVTIVGWVCVAIAVCVFAAPLSIVVQVIRTRSVEFMPFTLSFFLTLSAIMWFSYGLFKEDWCVAVPNVLGFVLGLLQMSLYAIYRKTPKPESDEKKIPEHIINVVALGGPEVHPVDPKSSEIENENNKFEDNKDEQEQEQMVSSDQTRMGPPPKEPTRATVQLGPSPPMLLVCAA